MDSTTVHSLYPPHSCVWKKATRLQSNLSSYIFFAPCNTVHTFLSSSALTRHTGPPLCITGPLRTSSVPLVATKPKHFARDAPCLLHSEGGLGSPPGVGWLAKQIMGSNFFLRLYPLKLRQRTQLWFKYFSFQTEILTGEFEFLVLEV